MSRSYIKLNLDEVIGDVSHLETLQHAAEISPFVTERSIGPDKDCWQDVEEAKKIKKQTDEKNTQIDNNLKKDEELAKEMDKGQVCNRTTTKRLQMTMPTMILTPPVMQNLDYQTINKSVLYREAEQQRKRAIRQHVIKLQERRLANARCNSEIERTRRTERDTWLLEHKRSDAFILQQAEQEAATEMKENERQMEMLRKQFESQLHVISFQGVSTYKNKFNMKYENISKLLMSIDKEALLSCTEYNHQLMELIQMFDQLIEKIKAGECGQQELKNAENLCKSLDALEESIIIELENIVKREKQQAEAYKEAVAAAAEEEKRQQEIQLVEQQKQKQDAVDAAATAAAAVVVAEAAATVTPPRPPNPTLSSTPTESTAINAEVIPTTTTAVTELPKNSSPSLEFYFKINTFYQEKVDKVKPLQSDENMKKWRFACQKAINIPVNAISAVSREHLQDKFEKLYNFIAGQPVKTTDGQISVNDHPLGRDYCLLLMAKKFVSQGDTAISSNAQAAFPVASVIVSLWKLVPDFGTIFLAYTYKESPFLVPYLVPQQPGQTVEDFIKVLGYRVNAEGQLEHQDSYLKRQAGIARLYAAIMITAGGSQFEATHKTPYGLEHGWRWMASFMCFEPLPDISATLLLEMLQILGAEMWATFGKQFIKFLFYLQMQYLPRLAAVDKGGPKERLELMLRKCLSEGQIPRAQGVLPPGFW